MTTSGDQTCFLFIVKKKNKIRPPTIYPPIQRLAESLIIFERNDNRNIFILQNTNTAGKTYGYALVYYPKKSIGFQETLTEESNIFIF